MKTHVPPFALSFSQLGMLSSYIFAGLAPYDSGFYTNIIFSWNLSLTT